MDLASILRSIEGLLFEIVSWLLFFPATLWRAVTAPIKLAAEVSAEFDLPPEERYERFLSPPIFLILCLAIGHLSESIIAGDLEEGLSGLMTPVVGGKLNFIAVTAVIAAVWPTLASLYVMVSEGEGLTRKRLRDLFYQQCVLVAPFVLGLSLAEVWGSAGQFLAVFIISISVAWYVWALSRWMANMLPLWRAIVAAVSIFLAGVVLNYLTINAIN